MDAGVPRPFVLREAHDFRLARCPQAGIGRDFATLARSSADRHPIDGVVRLCRRIRPR
jgi:hypothetical protein